MFNRSGSEMERDDDSLSAKAPALNTQDHQYTLISTRGFHCDAWRTSSTVSEDRVLRTIDWVVKVSKRSFAPREVRVLKRDHSLLRNALDDIIPTAHFAIGRTGDASGAIVIVEPIEPWFDLANPGNEGEALPLLRNTSRARDQLTRFTAAARQWLDEDGKLIDLAGAENLVLDRKLNVRYVDSFHVFLYVDLLDDEEEAGSAFAGRVNVAKQRLRYLERLVVALKSE